MLKGRLGLETARVPQAERHGLMWLGRGNLTVEDGTLRFLTRGHDDLAAGNYAVPFQMLSCILLQPGTTVSHDAMRLLARHGTGMVATGQDGVRFYASMPAGPDASARARRQARLWADEDLRVAVARRMYAWRLGEVLPQTDIAVLRGIEGARVKETYARLAAQYAVPWSGRRYDRAHPDLTDDVNLAINHAASAVEGAAQVAVAVSGVIPQLGFIHEDPGESFTLDLADLFRDSVTLPVAFSAFRERGQAETLERAVRRIAGKVFRTQAVIGKMIDRIKELFDGDDRRGHPERRG
jgi:CRISPR-associated protein Cas1